MIYAAPDVKQYSIYQIADTFYHMPPAILQTLLKNRTEVDIYSGAAEDPQGAPRAAAYYEPDKNRIVVHASSSGAQGAAAHEFAHAWEGPRYNIESQPGFKQAFTADLNDLNMGINGALWNHIKSSGKLADPPVINGVKAGDVFAEIVAGLSGYDITGMPAQMERAFPRTTQYLYNTLVTESNEALLARQQQHNRPA